MTAIDITRSRFRNSLNPGELLEMIERGRLLIRGLTFANDPTRFKFDLVTATTPGTAGHLSISVVDTATLRRAASPIRNCQLLRTTGQGMRADLTKVIERWAALHPKFLDPGEFLVICVDGSDRERPVNPGSYLTGTSLTAIRTLIGLDMATTKLPPDNPKVVFINTLHRRLTATVRDGARSHTTAVANLADL